MSKWFTAVVLSVLILSFSVTGYAQEIDLSILLERRRAPMFLQSSGQTYLLGVAGEQRDGKPPLSTGRIAGEILLGEVGGLVGLILGMVPASVGLAAVGIEEEEDVTVVSGIVTVAALAVTVVGTSLGSATGVYIVGARGEQTGSFSATMYGAAAGLGVGIVGSLIIYAVTDDPTSDPSFALGSSVAIFTLQAIGATIGFNLTRRYDLPLAGSKAAPGNVRDGLSVNLLRIGF